MDMTSWFSVGIINCGSHILYLSKSELCFLSLSIDVVILVDVLDGVDHVVGLHDGANALGLAFEIDEGAGGAFEEQTEDVGTATWECWKTPEGVFRLKRAGEPLTALANTREVEVEVNQALTDAT